MAIEKKHWSTFLYENVDGKPLVMGRSAMSWAKITFFYVVYYSFLAFLAYGSVGFWAGTVEDLKVPYVRTRTDQPGLAAEPADSVLSDDGNLKFTWNSAQELKNEKDTYLNRTMEFLKPYPKAIKDQFNEAYIRDQYKSGGVLYFLKLNRLNGWLPIGYPSAQAIADAGYATNGDPWLKFGANEFKKDGVYFYCAPDDMYKYVDQVKIDVEFLKMDRSERPFISSSIGYIPLSEYQSVQAAFKKRRKIDGLGSMLTPFVAVKISSEILDTQQKFNCYSIAQNTQIQRQLGVGIVNLGFIRSSGAEE